MNPRVKERTKEIFKILAVPLVLLGIYLSVYFIGNLFGMPSSDELIIIVRNWFAHYGLWVVFVGALIEGFLLLGQYFPGGFIIFLGVISAGTDVLRASEVVLIVSIAFFISYTLNYWVGKYGWYRLLVKFGLTRSIQQSQEKLSKYGLKSIFFTYWEPNLASLLATAAGIVNIPLVSFSLYSAAGIAIWNIVWGTLVFNLGESALKLAGIKYVIVICAGWVAVLIIKKYVFKKA